ncbi:MAG: hypothetical protein IPG17_16610 [Sandaracinaceae bacterium]|nr:hypothetical protein [Sandaracinaceae bacterium]MBP7681900.1 hypothetical protein [Deltaproteobacteria bacterium]MBK6810672.1 hypothetical protein [Sandaracinaceae bacterium]MBK7155056.1 hypothetical protein [Sandaracinaceae bacterium]MBK7774103.1 hypothetical protein [Sandaracinaceae bacterium]
MNLDRTLLYPILFRPDVVEERLDQIRRAGLVTDVPNAWQISLGVLRMWHRVVFRPESIGTSATHPVRPSLRARLLESRPLRFPFLLREKAVAPLDFSGLLSSPERVICHLLGAHHDGVQFVYDLQMLSVHPGKLEEALRRARDVVDGRDPRAEWMRDLTVYEGYHENLLTALERAVQGDFPMPAHQVSDPDISFLAYLEWCARQPKTPAETARALAAGHYSVAQGALAA